MDEVPELLKPIMGSLGRGANPDPRLATAMGESSIYYLSGGAGWVTTAVW
jgi:hypothetical protein